MADADISITKKFGTELSYPAKMNGPYLTFIPVKATFTTGSQLVGTDSVKKEKYDLASDFDDVGTASGTQTVAREIDESLDRISLHIPRGIAFSDNIRYNNIQSGVILSVLEQIRQKGLSGFNFNNEEITAYLARSGVGGEFLQGLRRQNLQRNQEIVSPREFVLFDAPSIRTFSMQYKFLPESQGEVEDVKKIIRTFRASAYPSFAGASTVVYKFPRAFLIEYIGIADQHMIKFPEVVLTSVNVTYNSNSMSYLKVEGEGTPYEIDLSLTFTELLPQSRVDIEAGY